MQQSVCAAQATGNPQVDRKQVESPTTDSLKFGEIMYLKGILPSGEPMKAHIRGDVTVDSSAFSCVSCHMRSGLGSVEGGVFTTPTNGRTLYEQRDLLGTGNNKPAGMSMTDAKKDAKNGIFAPQPPSARPAYSDATLAKVLREGVDPAGRVLDPIMPRYLLEDADMAILITYLKNLSTEYSPGVDKNFIRFATVVAPGVPQEQVTAMLEPLESFAKAANKQQEDHERQLVKLKEKKQEPTYRRVKVIRWDLKGSPDTWRNQLEEYYRREPVFALISGISPNGWEPMRQFCEENRIPSLLPNTDFPVISDTDWYTLYFSKGFPLEGSTAARYLKTQDKPALTTNIIQIVRDTPQGKSLAAGFEQELKEQGLPPATSIRLKPDDPLTVNYLQEQLERHKPTAIILWGNADDLKQAAAVPRIQNGSVPVILSGTYLGTEVWTIPEHARASIFITWPYRLPRDEERFASFYDTPGTDKKISNDLRIVKSRTYASLLVLTRALKGMRGNFYRDHLFDIISMKSDVEFPLYERFSFGPDQRYASKGCYIVQLSPGDKPEMVKKSEWVIH
jgi:ABC-type branched-subunit amino acid transport system substrate-binding protein